MRTDRGRLSRHLCCVTLAVATFTVHAADSEELPARPLPAPSSGDHAVEVRQAPDNAATDTPPREGPPGPATGTGAKIGRYIDDAAITTRIKTRLARDSSVKSSEIKVQTVHGTVQLSGFVKSENEKSRAGEIARDVSGVGEVRNDLVVRNGE